MFKVNVNTNAVFDFDFNILTAFIRMGRARPAGAGCPPYYYYLANAEINKLTYLTLIGAEYILNKCNITGFFYFNVGKGRYE